LGSDAHFSGGYLMEEGIERRRHERVKVSISVEWGRTPDCLERDRITSFSVGGCFVQTREAARKGEAIYVRFWLSPDAQTLLEGEVRYHLERVGFGLEFKGVTEEDQKHLQDLVEFFYERSTP
jgi:PilZ domain